MRRFFVVTTMQHVKIGIRTARLASRLNRAIATAAQCGVDGVVVDLRDEVPLADMSPTAVRQIRKWLDDANLQLAAVRFPTRRVLAEASGLDRRIAALRQAMQVAYELGARQLVQSGGVPRLTSDTMPDRQLIDHVAMLANWGERVGCRLVLESAELEVAAAREFVADLPAGVVGLSLHTGNIIAGGGAVGDVATALAEHWRHVVVADGYRDLASRSFVATELGRGSVDLAELAAVLDASSYQGWWAIEPDGDVPVVDQAKNAAAYLRRL